MLRSFFIYLSQAGWARQIVTKWSFARRAASRFVAGETLEDAVTAVEILNGKGIAATLDHLGENTTNPDEARRATEDIIQMLEAIEGSGVRSNISIKLTQIGLALSEGLCAENLRKIVSRADELDNFVRIDMEDSPWTETTIQLYNRVCAEFGTDRVGIVIQSYLYRSEDDVRRIASEGGRIRLCKGAYKEPPEIAFPEKADVDENFDKLTAVLVDLSAERGAPELRADGRIPPIPAIATHDEARIDFARAYATQKDFPILALEFQMLHGIRRDLQESLAKEGYPVRVYVPYGTEWYPYFTRRLAERPANVWFFLSNLLRR